MTEGAATAAAAGVRASQTAVVVPLLLYCCCTAADVLQVTGSWMTKIEALLRRLLLMRAADPGSKALVFSQYPDALALISKALNVVQVCVGWDGTGGVPVCLLGPSFLWMHNIWDSVAVVLCCYLLLVFAATAAAAAHCCCLLLFTAVVHYCCCSWTT